MPSDDAPGRLRPGDWGAWIEQPPKRSPGAAPGPVEPGGPPTSSAPETTTPEAGRRRSGAGVDDAALDGAGEWPGAEPGEWPGAEAGEGEWPGAEAGAGRRSSREGRRGGRRQRGGSRDGGGFDGPSRDEGGFDRPSRNGRGFDGPSRNGGGFDGPAEGSAAADGPPADPRVVARAVCLRLLTLAPRTRAQLAEALRKRNIPDEASEAVLARFSDVGLIDDEAFAEAWVTSRHAGRGLARRALAAELRTRGVAEETVRDALDQLDPDQELETARALVARKLPGTRGLEPAARVRRLAGMLARKGYSGALAYRVVREALESEGQPADDLLDGLE
ncbi:recombination regulator RecX [Sphaerisporangium sp. TRM90804]|uniref:recombination regulator RecX n=1 Tax=Sphaerisporangium sp. TRM90804 TaxID=3031113 RepID=UPI002449DA27|nr:recombination regulator RecX [Sphaerisporangium sp. TRM90804]MDH2425151.1 recombination regulator RecX [Sphaerisporangium sp. TRM90804]